MTADRLGAIAKEMRGIAPTCEPDWHDQLIEWANEIDDAIAALTPAAADGFRYIIPVSAWINRCPDEADIRIASEKGYDIERRLTANAPAAGAAVDGMREDGRPIQRPGTPMANLLVVMDCLRRDTPIEPAQAGELHRILGEAADGFLAAPAPPPADAKWRRVTDNEPARGRMGPFLVADAKRVRVCVSQGIGSDGTFYEQMSGKPIPFAPEWFAPLAEVLTALSAPPPADAVRGLGRTLKQIGWMRFNDGRAEFSAAPDCPPNRAGGLASPWFAIHAYEITPNV